MATSRPTPGRPPSRSGLERPACLFTRLRRPAGADLRNGAGRARGPGGHRGGKGTKYLPAFTNHARLGVGPLRFTPDIVPAAIQRADVQSFLDAQVAIEMAAVANATALPRAGRPRLSASGTDDLARVLRPRREGGVLHHRGQVEAFELQRDGREVARDLRWGVYVTFAADNAYVAPLLSEYGLVTTTRATMHDVQAYHLIGRARHLGGERRPAGRANRAGCAFRGDAVTVAKRDLAAGETLDGEGAIRLGPAHAGPGLSRRAPCRRLAHGVKTVRRVMKAAS